MGKDGHHGELFFAGPAETVHTQKDQNFIETYNLTGDHGAPLATGVAVGEKIGQGKAHVLLDSAKLTSFKEGEILVTTMTDPAWEPIMKRASAIVTERGGRTCHSAIISRELGIPCIVGTGNATEAVRAARTHRFVRRGTWKYLSATSVSCRNVNLRQRTRPENAGDDDVSDPSCVAVSRLPMTPSALPSILINITSDSSLRS